MLHPQTWKNRREAIFTESQKIYEERIRQNPLLTSHNLLGYIDSKINNPDPEMRDTVTIDMSQIQHPYELEQIENLNKVDQAKFLESKLE